MSKMEERNLSLESCKRIEINRNKKGLTRNELARRVNISYSYLYCIETAKKRGVTFNILKNVADVLEMDIDELLGIEKQEREPETCQSFENLIFNKGVTINGRNIAFEEKQTVYDVVKTLTEPDMKVSKKLERIISLLYGPPVLQ